MQMALFLIALVFVLTLAAAPSYAQYYDQQQVNEINRMVDNAINLLNKGRAQDAADYLERVVGKYPQSASLHFELGNAYSDLRNFDKAVPQYVSAIGLRKHFPEAVANIAYAYLNAGEEDKAIPWLERYVKEFAGQPKTKEVQGELLHAKAKLYMKQKRAYDAKQALEQAVQLAPRATHIRFALARAVDQLGDTKRAISEFEQVLKIKPDQWEATFNIAGCYQRLGLPDQAIEWYERYLRQQPHAQDREQVMGLIAAMKEKHSEFSFDPNSPDYCDAIKDEGKFYRWQRTRMPLKVFIDAGNGVVGFRPEFCKILYDSLNMWMKATQDRISFNVVPDRAMADIICEWTGNPHDVKESGRSIEQGVCLLDAAVPIGPGDAMIRKATVRILTIYRDKDTPLSEDDMKKACLHELGHAMGLQGHSTNNHDIMFFSMSNTVWPVISKRDRATIYRLYEQYPPAFGSPAANNGAIGTN